MLNKTLIALLLFGFASFGYSQKIVPVEGEKSFVFLKGQSTINVEFDYSDMGVGKFDKEEDYVKSKVEEYNKEEAGRGDKWKESCIGARERVYQPKFMELFNKGLTKSGMTGVEGGEAKYTLIVHTIFTEPGFNVGVASRPAGVSFEYIFVESDNREKVVAKFRQENIPGAQAMGMDFDTSTRISEAYAKAGKMLAAAIAKAVK